MASKRGYVLTQYGDASALQRRDAADGANAFGMRAILHRDTQTSIRAIDELLGR